MLLNSSRGKTTRKNNKETKNKNKTTNKSPKEPKPQIKLLSKEVAVSLRCTASLFLWRTEVMSSWVNAKPPVLVSQSKNCRMSALRHGAFCIPHPFLWAAKKHSLGELEDPTLKSASSGLGLKWLSFFFLKCTQNSCLHPWQWGNNTPVS